MSNKLLLDAQHLINNLLMHDPQERLGVTNGFDEIRDRPFLNCIDYRFQADQY